MEPKIEPSGWLDGKTEDPEFQRLYAREEAIEAFLSRIDQEMERRGVTRAELARRMECSPANVTQVMRRTANLTAATMVDLAFALEQVVSFVLSPRMGEAYLRNSFDSDTTDRALGQTTEVPGFAFVTYLTPPSREVAAEWRTAMNTSDAPGSSRTDETAGGRLAA